MNKYRWHEHDPKEILSSVKTCMDEVAIKLEALGISPSEVQGMYIHLYVDYV